VSVPAGDSSRAVTHMRHRWTGALIGFVLVAGPALVAGLVMPTTRDRWEDGYRMDPTLWQDRPAVASVLSMLVFGGLLVTSAVLTMWESRQTLALGLTVGAVIGMIVACGLAGLWNVLDVAGG